MPSPFTFNPPLFYIQFSFHCLIIEFFNLHDQFGEEQLGVYISDQVPDMLIGDPGRFRQIITNLMGNSIKVSAGSQKIIFF